MHDLRLLLTGALGLLCALGATGTLGAPGLPDPRTGGAGGGPVALLYLSSSPQMDAAYTAQLTQEGFTWTGATYYEPLTMEFLRKFNVVIIDCLPIAGEEYNTFGQHMLHYWANMKKVEQCVQEGAGLLVYTNLADNGGGLAAGWNGEMKRWGIQLQQACVLDRSLAFSKWVAYGENAYAWTENLMPHPVTEGLKRVYYPTANARWDDCYTAPPLLCDNNWTALVKAMPGARVATLVDDYWVYEPDQKGEPVLAAVRPVGKGRLGVLSINPTYTHRLGYTKLANNNYGEMSFGQIDGIILKQGNGAVPSDTGALVSRLYAWLAGDSGPAGFGGYKTGDPLGIEALPPTEDEKAFSPVLDPDTMRMPLSWRHRPASVKVGDKQYYPEVSDPLVTGELQFFTALVGVHSAFSDGQGSVQEYAAAAKQAGYSVVVFAENFEQLSPAAWDKLVADCARAGGEDFVCLPGFDIMDVDNNHYLLVAPPYYPRASWLSADGKRLVKVQMINLLYANHLVIAHRAETSPLPQERLKHFQGLSVYTYRNGRLVDESINAYAWQVTAASNPHPVSVHEVFSPAEVAGAATTGFQQLLPSDTVPHAAGYFRAGLCHYFDSPARYLISEGPIVYNWVINPKDYGPAEEGRMHFRVDIGVRSEAPLASVTLYDGFTPVRQWLPTGNDFQTRVDFQHGRQYDLFLIAVDTKGRRVLTSSMRTVTEMHHFRCGDRQNWLGFVGAYYTGLNLPNNMDITMPVQGTAEGSAIFTNVRGTCMAGKLNFPFTSVDVVLTEDILNEKYVDALREDVGADAMPSKASKASSVYEGLMRHYSFPAGAGRTGYPLILEFDLRLKRDVQPVDPRGLFPAWGELRDQQYAWYDKAGKLVSGTLKADEVRDIPVGGYAGGYVALSEGLRVDHGRIGLAPPADAPTTRPGGTRLAARLLAVGSPNPATAASKGLEDPAMWLKAMGFAGKPPYQLRLTRGKLEGVRFMAEITPQGGGAAGEVAATADLPFWVPLHLTGLNPRWPVGLWREDGTLSYTGVFEGSAWPRLDVGKQGKFYGGNLLTADNPDLALEVVKWDKDYLKIEVHNPTATPIVATVSTPREITTRRSYTRKVTVPAGTTIYVEQAK